MESSHLSNLVNIPPELATASVEKENPFYNILFSPGSPRYFSGKLLNFSKILFLIVFSIRNFDLFPMECPGAMTLTNIGGVQLEVENTPLCHKPGGAPTPLEKLTKKSSPVEKIP